MKVSGSPDQLTPLSEVIGMVKGWVERCGWIWTEAQIIELRRRSAVVQFLTMRDQDGDESATITCTRSVLDKAGPITEGTTVAACIHPVVYAKRGSLNFECRELQAVGEGRLLAMLEQRKRMLQAEGLFDESRKKPLPFLPQRIGLITGQGSAAEKDVVTNVHLRWPAAVFATRYALMQGVHCAHEVIAALGELDADPCVDVIVLARGGGSLEELLPFSDEGVVRAIAACTTPVVSAIGHEPDTPISDLVADLRASTPTDAAKRIVPDAERERSQIQADLDRLRAVVTSQIRSHQEWLEAIVTRPVLRDPRASLQVHYERLESDLSRLNRAALTVVNRQRQWVDHAEETIDHLSPQASLERGYSIVTDASGKSVTSVHQAQPGDQLTVTMSDGRVIVEVDYQGDAEWLN